MKRVEYLRDWIRGWILTVSILLLPAISGVGNAADPANNDAFILRFDSRITETDEDGTSIARITGRFMLDPVDGLPPWFYSGFGTISHTELTGYDFGTAGGALGHLEVSPNDGLVSLLFTVFSPPWEWRAGDPSTPLGHWISLYSESHLGEHIITDWTYPGGDVYARKTYDRKGATTEELTVIELSRVAERPRIERINIESAGQSKPDPETGETLSLSADLIIPVPFLVEKCTWTGSNFKSTGTGNPDDKCRWDYTPLDSDGPSRETYGDKEVTLTVVYRSGAGDLRIERNLSRDYKVFFDKKGDDDSNGQPNWFDYWGDDGAVPGLDDSNVKYQASIDAIAESDGSNVTFGADAADSDGTLTIPAGSNCPGGLFPGVSGIDLTAISLAHERKHNELRAIGGNDSDGDLVPNTAEAGTSTTNPDSCNLAEVINLDYAKYGDSEYYARRAELGVTGLPANDWAVPGRQAVLKTSGSVTSSSIRHTLNDAGPGTPASASGRPSTFQSQGGSLSGSYSATGNNSDGDSLFNTMVLNVGVNVTVAGAYTATAWLADNTGTEMIFANVDADLLAGAATLQIVFDGPSLNKLGVAQPFSVNRVELHARVGKHVVLRDAADDVLVTMFDSSNFDPPAATLIGALSESPEDSDADGLYNRLDIIIEMKVNDPGEYKIQGLLAGTGLSLSASQTINIEQSDTTEQVVLSFDGHTIHHHRENGPFELKTLRLIQLTDRAELDFEVNAWTTAALPFEAFEHSAVVIDQDSFADAPGSLDPDGKFSGLDLTFHVVFEFDPFVGAAFPSPGLYRVMASLEDARGRTVASVNDPLFLAMDGFSGPPTAVKLFELSFAGNDIFNSGVDGPYYVTGVTLISEDGRLVDQNAQTYMTGAYFANDFSGTRDEVIFTDGFE